jgi:hypothetical protein
MSRLQRWFPEFSAAARGQRQAPPKPWLMVLIVLFLLLLPLAPQLARWLAAALP